MSNNFWKELNNRIQGDLVVSEGMRGAYATDASVYQEFPRAVALPRNEQDVAILLDFCRQNNVCIIARGGGTSLSGQAIGRGLVIDYSRYMNRLIQFDPDAQQVIVEPGIVLDELNSQLARHNLHFAPDPATASRATIGGMIGNNSCGTRSIVYGRTCDSIQSLTGLLDDGTSFETFPIDESGWQRFRGLEGRMGTIYDGVTALVEKYRTEIELRVPKLPRVVAGYSLQSLLDASRPRSLSDLLCGSEGTLALVNRATLRLLPIPQATSLVITAFDSIDLALETMPVILETGPSAVELLDQVLIQEAVRNASTRDLAPVIVPAGTIPVAVQMVEFFGDSPHDASRRAAEYIDSLRRNKIKCAHRVLDDPSEQRRAWEVRRLGLGLISNLPGKAKAIALIEDACLPIKNLPEYNRFVFALGQKLSLGVSTYAHASVGVLHYKVMLDLHASDDRRKMREMAEACFEKCLQLGGVFSGEHGDGIVRGEFLPRQFGPDVFQAFVDLKRLFDPRGMLNPGRKIDSPPLDGPLRFGGDENSRQSYLRSARESRSHFRYAEHGGLVGAVEQCNGVGACRQTLKGTMCPSYRATRDERDSTRGRANLLRLAISGQLDPPGLANPDLQKALDLCLACKACESECPNAVDLARLKSEALQTRWEKSGPSATASFVGRMPQRLARFHRVGWLGGFASNLWPARVWLQKYFGIDRRRPLPLPAAQSFDRWLKSRANAKKPFLDAVALFVDTWNRFTEPEIAIGAVVLLESCGYRVEVPRSFDALRTRLSTGLLTEARGLARDLYMELATFTERDIPIVCLEPSEASALIDDLPDLAEDHDLARGVASRTSLLDDFLARELLSNKFQLRDVERYGLRPVLLHPHCHQRALFRSAATVELLAAAGYPVELSDWGCCGMAGSFGYTHYNASKQIAELKFVPGIKTALSRNQIVVATGTSCRQQARDFCNYSSPHWVQLVRGIVQS